MSSGNPDLRIVPIGSIKLQEGVTDEKAHLLAENMERLGEIINPVVTAPLENECFVQLDEASRLAVSPGRTVGESVIEYL